MNVISSCQSVIWNFESVILSCESVICSNPTYVWCYLFQPHFKLWISYFKLWICFLKLWIFISRWTSCRNKTEFLSACPCFSPVGNKCILLVYVSSIRFSACMCLRRNNNCFIEKSNIKACHGQTKGVLSVVRKVVRLRSNKSKKKKKKKKKKNEFAHLALSVL